MSDVVLRLKGDCGDDFSPIGRYMRVIGSIMVSPLSQNSNSLFEYLSKMYLTFGRYNISV